MNHSGREKITAAGMTAIKVSARLTPNLPRPTVSLWRISAKAVQERLSCSAVLTAGLEQTRLPD